ncbi:MAG TPA: squalene--hopene cyclase [Actinomycetota bacterium]|jgi:squalene-hopene/tetraprenyl-beta-curcumene cyclase|nr:squalene--hopene cyclase [Actinomycetota bacterium]
MTLAVGREIDPKVAGALERGAQRLLDMQDRDGWWKGDLETNVTMDAEDLMLREFLGVRGEERTRGAAAWIRSRQREDGTWATFHGGPPELSTTIEAYLALRLAGDPPEAGHMRKAAGYVREAGGIERSRVFTRLWLALLGLWDWEDLPVLPPEMIFLPPWAPLSIYDFGCWARQTIVPLTIVSALRPVRRVGFGLDELRVPMPPRPLEPLGTWAGRFQRLDRWLHAYQRRPVEPLRRLATRRAVRWIIERQEADGCWGGIQPPWVYSIIALHLLGYPLDHPVLRSALEGLDRFTVRDGPYVWLEACQSPVWDTGLALIALSDAGLAPDHPALVRAGEWLLGEEVRKRGDWAVRRPQLAPGGWAFEFANDNYPDVDDTAEVVLALRRVAHPDRERLQAAVARGIAWVIGMQSRDGGWAAFDADNVSTLPLQLPFCDFGAVTDPPSADVTAHVVEMLAVAGLQHSQPARRGLDWLLRHQERDGSWFGRWGANHVYGVGACLPALVAAGISPEHSAVRRAVRWLVEHQSPDGGWGEDLRSYREPEWRGHGTSTASQTAWALLALLAAGERDSPAAARGAAWLAEAQLQDGSWDEPWFTGTGFPGDFYINYHLYRQVFPVMALGRYVRGGPGAEEAG